MAGDNERFSARSYRWIKVATFIASSDTTFEEAVKFILDSISITFSNSCRELKKINFLEEAIQAFVDSDVEKLHELVHKTKGNQVVQIMTEAQKMNEQPKIAIQRILCEYIERLFSDITAQARTDPKVYMRSKERLDMARKHVPAIAEKLAGRLVGNPFGRWPRNNAPEPKLSDSLL